MNRAVVAALLIVLLSSCADVKELTTGETVFLVVVMGVGLAYLSYTSALADLDESSKETSKDDDQDPPMVGGGVSFPPFY